MFTRRNVLTSLLVCVTIWCPARLVLAAEQPPLIPREVLFGNPDRASVQLSPDGEQISFLAPRDGVLNVWVGPAGDADKAKPVTDDKKRGIRSYFWAFTSDHVLYLQDKDGDENWRVYSVDLANETTKDLTPLEDVRAQIQEVSRKFPKEMLIGLNDRDRSLHDIYRVNIETGERALVEQNEGYMALLTDDDFRVRMALKMTPDGGMEVFRPTEEGDWQPDMKIPMEDMLTTSPIDFNKTGDVLYLRDSRGRNTAALAALDLKTGEKTILAEDQRADINGVLQHPTEKNIQAAASTYERVKWQILDEAIADDFEYLRSVADGDFSVASRTLDDKSWIVAYVVDDGPVRYYRYDREAKQAEFLFTNRSELEDWTLATMHPVVIESRDGLGLVSYYTLPQRSDSDADGLPDSPMATVLLVHGGPWGRDDWGLNPLHQWLANRGYAVLSVNFRASTGLGKDFINAGNREWGAAMHDDLIDAVNWAVEQRIADPEQVAIMGGSYGGYATLVGLTFTPDVFTCGVDIVGPSNLVTLLRSIPPYWKPQLDLFTVRVGDIRTEEGREFLKSRSPLTYAERIKKPLLIGQGANDPRVKQAESDQIVEAMQSKQIPVTYVLYPDEGHGFARPENRLSFFAVAEAFLAEHLGGRFEPVGDSFEGSSIEIPAGEQNVPGLKAALEGE